MNPNLENVVFTYGDIIYCPSGMEIPEYLMKHEEIHCNQQGNDPKGWWKKYIDDVYFRIKEESESYAHQYAFICSYIHDRNNRSLILSGLAAILSGPTYGKVMEKSAAYTSIKKQAEVILMQKKYL